MANRTFADYAASLSSGTLDSVIGLDGSTVKTGEPGGASYLVYTALLTQSGTDAPVATILENTLGGTVVWSYEEAGAYIGTLAGAFTESKTLFFFGPIDSTDTQYRCQRIDVDSIRVLSYNTGTQADGELNDTSLEIRVYP